MSIPYDRFQSIEPEEAEKLLIAIETQLKNRFCEIYEQKYNPNMKGHDYEKILAKFFEDYLGGAFDFLVRVGVLDMELKVNSVLTPKENEFDVIAIYKNAIPKLVQHKFVPYDSVAFITEAKQTLTTTNLKKDLLKFKKLSKLKVANNRPNIFSSSNYFADYKVKRPIRFLFYYEKKADTKKIIEILEGENGKFWDVCVIFKENIALLNSTLPYVKQQFEKAHFTMIYDFPLLKGLFFTCFTIKGIFIDSWLLFWNLFRSTAKP